MRMDELMTRLHRIDAGLRVRYAEDDPELTMPPPTPQDLERVEAALGLRLPDSYRDLLLHYGAGMPLDTPVNWYRAANRSGYRGLIESNANRPVPHLVYILDCGDGDNIALDLSRRDGNGEPVVVRTDHEALDERTTDVAPNLIEFIVASARLGEG